MIGLAGRQAFCALSTYSSTGCAFAPLGPASKQSREDRSGENGSSISGGYSGSAQPPDAGYSATSRSKTKTETCRTPGSTGPLSAVLSDSGPIGEPYGLVRVVPKHEIASR